MIDLDKCFDKEFWDGVVNSIQKEDKQWKEDCKKMKIDPVFETSTMTFEERNKKFNF